MKVRNIFLISTVLGVLITVILATTTANMDWDESTALCPGIPYETTAVLSGGFPIRYNVSMVSALGTCGTITMSSYCL